MSGYRDLGNRAVSVSHAVPLSCHHCMVSWSGCAAECCCPECGAPKGYHQDDLDRCHCETCRGCSHTITRGREGAKGSWCEACGIQVLEVHDRPCGECKHHLRIGPEGFGGSSICRRHLMAVVPDMHVTFYLVPGPGRSGLCFEALDGESS